MDTKLTHEEIATLTSDALAKISDWLECNIPDLTGLPDSTETIIDYKTIPELYKSCSRFYVRLIIEDEKASIKIQYCPSFLADDTRIVEICVDETGAGYEEPFVSVFQALSITSECWDVITTKIIATISIRLRNIEGQINKLPNCIASLVKFTE